MDKSKLALETVAPVAPAPPPKPSVAPGIVARLVPLLEELRASFAGSDQRKELVLELLQILQQGSELTTKEQRSVARAYADNDGPEICYEIESCMNGDWMRDAKNGVLSAMGKIGRLPGPIGQALFAYRGVREKLKIAAAHGHCGQEHEGQRTLGGGVTGS